MNINRWEGMNMDMVVNRLSEIEEASVKIINEATAQKKELEDEMTSELQQYDAEIDLQTEEALEQLQKSLHQQMAEALNKLQADTQCFIEMQEADYEAHHEKQAARVLKKLLER